MWRFGLPDSETTVPDLARSLQKSNGLEYDIIYDSRSPLLAAKKEADSREAYFWNGNVVRLEHFEKRTSQGREKIKLFLRPTNYYTHIATNNNRDIVSQYAPDHPAGFMGSTLANNLAVDIYLLCADSTLIYTRRSTQVTRNPNKFAPSVSGDMDPDKDRYRGCPNPFKTAYRETLEELSQRLGKDADPRGFGFEDIEFYALLMHAEEYQPVIVGVAHVDYTFEELTQLRPGVDSWERADIGFFRLDDNGLQEMAKHLIDNRNDWEDVSAAALILVTSAITEKKRVEDAFRKASRKEELL